MIKIIRTEGGQDMVIGQINFEQQPGQPYWGTKDIPNYPHIIKTLEERIRDLQANLEAAVKEQNRRDEKWISGLRDVISPKLDFGNLSSPHTASTVLKNWAIEQHAMADKYAAERDEWRRKYLRTLGNIRGNLEAVIQAINDNQGETQP